MPRGDRKGQMSVLIVCLFWVKFHILLISDLCLFKFSDRWHQFIGYQFLSPGPKHRRRRLDKQRNHRHHRHTAPAAPTTASERCAAQWRRHQRLTARHHQSRFGVGVHQPRAAVASIVDVVVIDVAAIQQASNEDRTPVAAGAADDRQSGANHQRASAHRWRATVTGSASSHRRQRVER